MPKSSALQAVFSRLFAATNIFDVDAAVALFSPDAVIDDPSVGQLFVGFTGIRDYLERYFVGYHTVTRILSVKMNGDDQATVWLDFTGDFGHEIGRLDVIINCEGLIQKIHADLE